MYIYIYIYIQIQIMNLIDQGCSQHPRSKDAKNG